LTPADGSLHFFHSLLFLIKVFFVHNCFIIYHNQAFLSRLRRESLPACISYTIYYSQLLQLKLHSAVPLVLSSPHGPPELQEYHKYQEAPKRLIVINYETVMNKKYFDKE
ncbi:MAG: hypothetical protein II213_00160, partial [Lachnospiraceae bacterium]|nr:hypothetical protein [Lachnospiraceae bacterium]